MISILVSLRSFKSISFFLPCVISISFRDFLLFGKQRRDKETPAIFFKPLFISRRAKKIPGPEDAFKSQQCEISFDARFVRFDFSGFQLNQGGRQHHFRGSWGNYCVYNWGNYCFHNWGNYCFYNWGNYCFCNWGNYCVYNWRTWCPAVSTRFVILSCALLTSFRFSPTKKPRKRGRLVHFSFFRSTQFDLAHLISNKNKTETAVENICFKNITLSYDTTNQD